MIRADEQMQVMPRCVLCPAACELHLQPAGPNLWRGEPPPTSGTGLCPRGSAMGELVSHRRRILSARRCAAGRWAQVPPDRAVAAIVDRAGGGSITFLVDGQLPLEQLARAAAWCGAWTQARFCVVVEPAERELLMGLEASGCEYLSPEAVAGCDGFLLIGDVFAANPACARGVLDARAEKRRMPIVAIDPAGGASWKFATHAVGVAPGREAEALAEVIAAARIPEAEALCSLAGTASEGADGSVAALAGAALAAAGRVGVLVAAEYGRTAAWRQIGYMAGRLASALGGGVSAQTAGANALGAVRLAEAAGAISLAKALEGEGLRVALGCDPVGMLGRGDMDVFAAAAALPNETLRRAEIVLPLPLPCELSGTVQPAGGDSVAFGAALAPPAGVKKACEWIAATARHAGVGEPAMQAWELPPRVQASPPPPATGAAAPPGAVLLARQASGAGCGELTGHGSWQQAGDEGIPQIRIAPDRAAVGGLKNLSVVKIRSGERTLRVRVRIAPELAHAAMVLPECSPACRAMAPARIDAATDTICPTPTLVEVDA